MKCLGWNEESRWEMGCGRNYCLGKSGGIWRRSQGQITDSGTGDKINTAMPRGQAPNSGQTHLWPADLLQRERSAPRGLKTVVRKPRPAFWDGWLTLATHIPHEWAYCGYLPCKFWHKRAVGAAPLLRYRFIASVSSSSHDCFIANPFSVQRINHAAGCQGSPFMLLRRLQERVLEILLNSKEVLIMLSAFIRFFQCCVSCYIRAQRGLMESQLTDTVCAQNRQRIWLIYEIQPSAS